MGNLQEQISLRWNVTREAAAQIDVSKLGMAFRDASGGKGKKQIRCRFCDFDESTA